MTDAPSPEAEDGSRAVDGASGGEVTSADSPASTERGAEEDVDTAEVDPQADTAEELDVAQVDAERVALLRLCAVAVGVTALLHAGLVAWYLLRTDGVGGVGMAKINLFFGILQATPTPAFVTFLAFASLCPVGGLLGEAWVRRRHPNPKSATAVRLGVAIGFGLGAAIVLVAYLHAPYLHYSLLDDTLQGRPDLAVQLGWIAFDDLAHVLVLGADALAAAGVAAQRLLHLEGSLPLLGALVLTLGLVYVSGVYGLLAAPALFHLWAVPEVLRRYERRRGRALQAAGA
jgi:hypothetical protein